MDGRRVGEDDVFQLFESEVDGAAVEVDFQFAIFGSTSVMMPMSPLKISFS